jgi:integrase
MKPAATLVEAVAAGVVVRASFATSALGRCRSQNGQHDRDADSTATSGALKSVESLKKDRTSARETPNVRPASDDDVDRVVAELSAMHTDAVRVQRLTGMRPGELLGMTVEAIDRSDPTMWLYRPEHHKTEQHELDRVVRIASKAIEIPAPWILQTGSGRLFQVKRDGFRQAIGRACKQAGVAPCRPSQLRHSFATEVRAEPSLQAAQILVGHTRAGVTQI